MNPKKLLTTDQVAQVETLWAEGRSEFEITQALGVTVDWFRLRRKDQLRHLPTRPRALNSGKRAVDPTEDEIALGTAMLRQGWSLDRWLGYPDQIPAGETPA